MSSYIHSSFWESLRTVIIIGVLSTVIGLVVLGFSLSPNMTVSSSSSVGVGPVRVGVSESGPHPATAGERAFILLIGLVFGGIGVFALTTNTGWLHRATIAREKARPVPMRLTTKVVQESVWRTQAQIPSLRATLRPADANSPTPVIVDMPLYHGVVSQNTRMSTVNDVPVQVYFDSDPAGPVVVDDGKRLLCSRQGYTRPRFNPSRPTQRPC
ncbi:MAG: hypothetical protein ACYC7E_00180 [Armatimonadota bacterium]